MSQPRLELLMARAESAAAEMTDREVEELKRLLEACPRGLRVARIVRRQSIRVTAPPRLVRQLAQADQTVVSSQISVRAVAKVTLSGS